MLGLTGDDTLIRRQHGLIYLLVGFLIVLVIFVTFAFGYVQILPKSRHDQTCSYVIHRAAQDYFIRFNWPELPRKCS